MTRLTDIENALAERGVLNHLKMIALSTGLVAYGVALGLKWAITDAANRLGVLEVAPIAPLMNQHMRWMLILAAVGLVLAAWIDTRGESA